MRPRPPMGAGLAQAGYHHYEKRISTEQFFSIDIPPCVTRGEEPPAQERGATLLLPRARW